MNEGRRIQIIASDAGGTMTDMIVVDTDGDFSIGKAATTTCVRYESSTVRAAAACSRLRLCR